MDGPKKGRDSQDWGNQFYCNKKHLCRATAPKDKGTSRPDQEALSQVEGFDQISQDILKKPERMSFSGLNI